MSIIAVAASCHCMTFERRPFAKFRRLWERRTGNFLRFCEKLAPMGTNAPPSRTQHSSRFQLLGPRSLRGTFGDRGQQRLDCSSNFFADRVSQTSAPDPTRRSTFMEVVREQDVDTHVLSSVCPWI